MKHRSVIAFVIVAAALFSLPQLSHDLQELKGAVGSRLHSELLHAFLSLPVGDPVAAARPARRTETLLASCTQRKSVTTNARSGRAESNGRANENSFERRAMIGDPLNDPINHLASVEVEAAEVEAEVAMIVPPESGIDPQELSNVLTTVDVARAEADGLRVAYTTAARSEAKSVEWQKAVEEATRRFDSSQHNAYEFRLVREGAKARVMKLKCGQCPASERRLPRVPGSVKVFAPLPSPVAPAAWVGE